MALTKVTGDFIKAGSITQGHLHSSHGITTSHITEGDKLFFTNARVDSRVGSLSSSDLSEGTNLYYTDARARAAISGTGSLSYNSTTGVMSFTMPAQNTSNITEGSNLYYTDARADARVALIVDSAPGTLNTLNELAAALGDDANFATTTANSIGTKWTQDNAKITNWDTAYGWGDHGSGGYAADSAVMKLTGNQTISGTKTFDNASIVISGTHGTISFMDTTSGEDNFYLHTNSNNFYVLADRDATDAIDGGYDSPHPLQLEGDTNTAYVFGSALNISNWNTAYGWGNHASAGYLTSYTEADTLATVTGRGASTSNNIAINAGASYPLQTSSSQRYGIQIRNTNNTVNSAYGWWWGTDTNFDMFFHCDGGSDRFTLTRQGEATAFASMSAPIYYDRNDTAYYVNPASRSNIGDLDLNSGAVWDATTQGTGKGSLHLDPNSGTDHAGAAITFGASDASNGGNAQAGIYIRSDGSYGTKMYFATTDSYATGSKTSMNILENGQVNITRNNLIVNSDVRGTIFYDSNNTTYFLNPSASGGNALNTIGDWRQTSDSWSGEVGGKMQYHGNHWYLQAGGYVHFRNASGTNTFYVDQNGTGYINDYLTGANSLRAPIFYDSNDTTYYTNPNSQSSLWGVAVRGDQNSTSTENQIFFWGGGNSTTSAIGFKSNGGYFTNPTGNGDGYNTYLTMDTAGRGWVFRQGNGGANFTSLNNSGWILNNGIWQANASMRSPIFYDSNNTGYYVDPNSTSRLLNLDFGVSGYYLKAGDWGTRQQTPYGWIQLGPANTSHAHIYTDRSNFYFNQQIQLNGGSLINTNDIRAQIFYDLNDTGYYVNPASKSILHSIHFNGSVSGTSAGSEIGRNHVYDTMELKGYGAEFMIGAQNAEININYRTCNGGVSGHTPTTWKWRAGSSSNWSNHYMGLIQSSDSMRAPIFYDSNNTSYYTDPGSSSSIVSIAVKGEISFPASGLSTLSAGSRPTYSIYQEGGGWSNPFPDLCIAMHTGIKLGANANYNGIRFYTDYDMSTQVMSVNNASDGYGAGHVHINQICNAGASMRSPIFYDSNNTGYYVDPADGNVAGNFSGGIQMTGNYGVGITGLYTSTRIQTIFNMGTSYKLPNDGNSTSNAYGLYWSHQNAGSKGGANNLASHGIIILEAGSYKGSWGGGRLVTTNDIRGTRFYDYNNTGYYVDPASTSVIVGLTMAGALQTAGSHTVGSGGTSNIYMGGTSGNYFRFHCTSGSTYFDMNSGNINWRQGSSTRFIFYSTTANMTVYGTVTQHSDLRIKDNVVEIPNCIDKVKSIRGIYYNRTDFNTEPTKIGVVAQEVEVEMPELVHDEETSGIKSVSYTELTAVLVNAIKEQQTIIDDLKTRLETLENQ
jgi:hypothetical protein